MSRSIWTTLGISPTNDTDEVRRAYARRLKEVHPEDDPEGFQALRAAYDQASNMARNKWAVPETRPGGEDDEAFDDDDDWPDEVANWRPAAANHASRGWAPPPEDRWARATPEQQAAAEAELPDDIRAELARERDLAEAHQGLCDALTKLIANLDGDRHEALAAMIRVFRSPAMDSLTTHARTEQWLAHVISFGGPVVDDMVEPAIQFFGWDSTRVGVDLRHAEPVLRRREAGLTLRRLERSSHPDHDVWKALTSEPTRIDRIRQRLTPKFAGRVNDMLQRFQYEHPDMMARMNPASEAHWRAWLERPGLGPIFLWTLMIGPGLAALMLNATGDFGPPSPLTFFAFWTVIGSALFALGVGYLHGITRPRLAWRAASPWHRPLWQRFGWAPAALALLVIAGAVPPAWWVALLLLPLSFVVWTWARITSSHVPPPYGVNKDWGRYAGLAPIAGYLLLQGGAVAGQAGTALLVAFVGAAAALQVGAEAIADEFAQWDISRRRRAGATQLAVVVIAALAVVGSAASGWGMGAACGVVTALSLGDRAMAWGRIGSFVVPRRSIMLAGWIGGLLVSAFLPFPDLAVRTFVGLSLWLLLAATLTGVASVLEGRSVLPERFRRKKKGRTPGELA
ncbi:hypothetical protein GGQ87_001765 [Brevundimonas alba]|uniref:J domain-containing protein n=1 Tax=Brevundimonas alba TaxID=74314 RepID=A0A7X5YKU7_9CAUL|nr:hypothetical protein [Brevundimonas alba]NJC41507.1 hypothetical protein [Brevundimonas alba]